MFYFGYTLLIPVEDPKPLRSWVCLFRREFALRMSTAVVLLCADTKRDGDGGNLCYSCREKLPPALLFPWERDAVRSCRQGRVCTNRRANQPFTRIFWKSPSRHSHGCEAGAAPAWAGGGDWGIGFPLKAASISLSAVVETEKLNGFIFLVFCCFSY